MSRKKARSQRATATESKNKSLRIDEEGCLAGQHVHHVLDLVAVELALVQKGLTTEGSDAC